MLMKGLELCVGGFGMFLVFEYKGESLILDFCGFIGVFDVCRF